MAEGETADQVGAVVDSLCDLIGEIAQALNLGESAVRRRFRAGAALYRRSLTSAFGTRAAQMSANGATVGGQNPSP